MSRRLSAIAAFRASAGLAILAATTLPAAAQMGYGPYYGHGMGWGGGYGMFLGPLFFILILAAIVVGAIALFRRMDGGQRGRTAAGQGEQAIDILKARYARGEIDSKEYEERKRMLAD